MRHGDDEPLAGISLASVLLLALQQCEIGGSITREEIEDFTRPYVAKLFSYPAFLDARVGLHRLDLLTEALYRLLPFEEVTAPRLYVLEERAVGKNPPLSKARPSRRARQYGEQD